MAPATAAPSQYMRRSVPNTCQPLKGALGSGVGVAMTTTTKRTQATTAETNSNVPILIRDIGSILSDGSDSR